MKLQNKICNDKTQTLRKQNKNKGTIMGGNKMHTGINKQG